MIRDIRKKVGIRFAKEGCSATVTFRKDDLIKEHNSGIMLWSGFALMNKFVEAWNWLVRMIIGPFPSRHTLSLLQHMHVVSILVREASQKPLHIKAVNHTRFLLVPRGRL